ncbi:peptidase inhibitor family I36 protein [Arthrobacter sp. H5]|uniref:peptidase inhibitor family I36 protein n=1 Tax=Arthrobacter sp. H5 TaxID=1267973 RepID=UPI0004825E3A|nr:peptidase inhibitor family I36 protein [Arthrobacter sp. H5]
MKLASKLAGASALLGLVAGAMLAGAPGANASGTGTACPINRVCLYFNSNFEGARADFAYSDAGLGNELFTDGPAGANGWGVQVNNNAASLINRTGSGANIYDGRDCTGEAWATYGGERLNLASIGMKNRVSSIQIDGDCINRDQSWA